MCLLRRINSKISFKRNLGLLDRSIRMLLGLTLIWISFLGIFENQFIINLGYLLGVLQIIESILGY
ncbi:YgaP-like transmembrane domain [Fuchsiella alkaliacetigena]|uniref:YgaP-like transmembrane domain n=1 Tax=Fuchsiella alkaliacetigena TaxID=957042 RepID=UPI003555EBE7